MFDTISMLYANSIMFEKPITLLHNNYGTSNTSDTNNPNLNYYLSTSKIVFASGCINTALQYKTTQVRLLVNVCIQCLPPTTLATTTNFPICIIPNTTICDTCPSKYKFRYYNWQLLI
jgi:hypothetical protein